MPIYSFRDDDENLVELHLSFSGYDAIYENRHEDGSNLIDGQRLRRDIRADLGPKKTADVWPLPSESLAIDPSQIRDAMARDAKVGIPTDYRKDGCPIFRSENHRSSYIKSQGLQDLKRYN